MIASLKLDLQKQDRVNKNNNKNKILIFEIHVFQEIIDLKQQLSETRQEKPDQVNLLFFFFSLINIFFFSHIV